MGVCCWLGVCVATACARPVAPAWLGWVVHKDYGAWEYTGADVNGSGRRMYGYADSASDLGLCTGGDVGITGCYR